MNSLKKRWNVYLPICVMMVISLISCSQYEQKVPESSNSEQSITKFRSEFYKDGRVYANQVRTFSPTEWCLYAESAQQPLDVFTRITNMPVSLKDNYDYQYTSSDGKSSIRIVGKAVADKDGTYATLYVRIQGCEDITTLHITTPDFLKRHGGGLGGIGVLGLN